MDNFFNFKTGKKTIISVRQPDIEMSIIKRLGKPKFWISNNDFFETVEKIYTNAYSNALEHYSEQTSNEDIQYN